MPSSFTNLQKPDIRELRRPFNPKIAPSEFVPRAEPKVATGTMDLTLPCMLNLFRVIYSSSGKSFAYTTFYYTQTSKSGLSWTDAILIHPATLSQWPYAPLDWHTKGSASVKGTAVLEGTLLKFPGLVSNPEPPSTISELALETDLMTVFPCFWTLKLLWKIIFCLLLFYCFLDIARTFNRFDLAASSRGSDCRAFSKQLLASSQRPSATNTSPRLLLAGAYPGHSSNDLNNIFLANS